MSWVDRLKVQPLKNVQEHPSDPTISIISWNILAEAYTTPRSHPNLPDEYANKTFHTRHRRSLILDILRRLLFLQDDIPTVDVLCLQEVELVLLNTLLIPFFHSYGYSHEYAPRSTNKSHTMKNSSDGCATFYLISKWKCIGSKIIHFDDLANPHRPPLHAYSSRDTNLKRSLQTSRDRSALLGISSSYQRRNAALLIHLVSTTQKVYTTESTTTTTAAAAAAAVSHSSNNVIIANTHLFWHPGYEYVKLSQAYYLLHCIQQFTQDQKQKQQQLIHYMPSPAILLCGDFNSKPESIVYQFITQACVDATLVAPWNQNHPFYDSFDGDDEEEAEPMEYVDAEQGSKVSDSVHDTRNDSTDKTSSYVDETSVNKDSNTSEMIHARITSSTLHGVDLSSLHIHEASPNKKYDASHTGPRYMLDFTLNKLTRWLRILGIDAALETEEEERARTKDGKMILFQKCRQERRNLITTSYKLTQRKECPPGSYLITLSKRTQDLESTLVDLLLLHGVTLRPRLFLSRCVVCNGVIVDVPSKEKQASIFAQYGSPDFSDALEVYQCSNCEQGYWWSESPKSSASRVKDLSTHLFVQCLRGGIPIEGPLDFFSFVDVEKESKMGLEARKKVLPMSLGVGGIDEVVGWLKDKALGHSYHFRSAYEAGTDDDDDSQLVKFTNVTFGFVGILDYIFFDVEVLQIVARMSIPLSFLDLNSKGIERGHLLPSDIWPSDHIAVGAKFRFMTREKAVGKMQSAFCSAVTLKTDADHGSKCNCGCVPPILSLFEMAELRRQYRLLSKTGTGSSLN